MIYKFRFIPRKQIILFLILGLIELICGEKLGWTEEGKRDNPEEKGLFLEGDMLIQSSMTRIWNGFGDVDFAGDGFGQNWPHGVVPYIISDTFDYNQVKIIHDAMADFEKYTCIRFKRRQDEKLYLQIDGAEEGCYSDVGRNFQRATRLNLGVPDCVTIKGTVIHELMHAIGFRHEQSRPDRNTYVQIMTENIEPDKISNFDIHKIDTYGIDYDPRSIMHYSAYIFSRNGMPTIIPRGSMSLESLGQREGFTRSDILRIKKKYKCYIQNTSIKSKKVFTVGPTQRPFAVRKSRNDEKNRASLKYIFDWSMLVLFCSLYNFYMFIV